MIGLKKVPGKTSLPRQGPFLVSREEKKIMKARKNTPFLMSIIRLLPKTPKGRMQYAPTACRSMGFGFVLPQVSVKPGGFHSDVWQSPKPAGFYAMSCGKVQNPPGFALCRVAKSKTRRVSRYVVWQGPKPAGFYAMSCGEVQNPPGFALCRLTKSKTRRVSRYVVWQNAKPIRYQAVGAYCIRPLGVFGGMQMIGIKRGVFFSCSHDLLFFP